MPALEADLNSEKYIGSGDFFYSEFLKMPPSGKFQSQFTLTQTTEVRIAVQNPKVKIAIMKGSTTIAKSTDYNYNKLVPGS